VWDRTAENVAESLRQGDAVVVSGRLVQREYEDKDGVKRTVYDVKVRYVGASLRNATAKIVKAARSGVSEAASPAASPWDTPLKLAARPSEEPPF